MVTEVISAETIDTIGKYTIVKTKERAINVNGRPCGRIKIWFDVCLDDGEGDIVASYHSIKEAREWVKEN